MVWPRQQHITLWLDVREVTFVVNFSSKNVWCCADERACTIKPGLRESLTHASPRRALEPDYSLRINSISHF